jgi:hypothetical protein
MWLAVHGVPPSAYLRWIRWVGGPRGDIGLEKGPCASFPTCHFFRALVFPVRLLKIHDDFRHLKARCGTFLAHFWNIFAGSGPSFSEGAYCFSFCVRICPRALELAPFTDVEFPFPAWHPTFLDIPCGLIGQTLQSSASDGIRTAGT